MLKGALFYAGLEHHLPASGRVGKQSDGSIANGHAWLWSGRSFIDYSRAMNNKGSGLENAIIALSVDFPTPRAVSW